MPKTKLGEFLKTTVAVTVGGGILTVVYNYVWPIVRSNSNVILPFALSNGVACMFWQVVLESMFGLSALAGTATLASLQSSAPMLYEIPILRGILTVAANLPLGGAALGVLTVVSAPLLWATAIDLVWSPELKQLLLGSDGNLWLLDLYFSLALPVGIPVGLLSGRARMLISF